MFLDIVYVKGIFDITFARNAHWGHVDHALPPSPEASASRESAGVRT
jgi:hypothetical protein